MKNILKAAIAVALTSALTLPAHAETDLGEHLKFSGFGTFGAVRTSTDQALFGQDRQPGGADTSPEFDVDSNLGFQLSARANDWLSATVQALAIKRDEPEVKMEPEWAFVKATPLAGLAVRLGRMPLPTFVVSDSRNVGYANTWLRAPNEVYGLSMLRRMQGADVTYRRSIGGVGVSATALYGDSGLYTFGSSLDANDVRGGSAQVEFDGVTLRAGRIVSDVVVAAGTPTERYAFTGYGVTLDRGSVIAQAEYVQRRTGTYYNIVAANGWYLMGGYRFGTVTPYAIVSRTTPLFSASRPPVQLVTPMVSEEQSTVAVGARWDAFDDAALKFQVERVDTDGSFGISFSGPVSRPVTVVSAAYVLTF
jgi:hypothetical protein